MDKKKSRRPLITRGELKETIKQHKAVFTVYIILRLSVIAIMIAQFLNGEYYNVFMCLFTLLLFTIPSFVERRIKIDVPDLLEVIILLFIYAAEILGEIREYYVNVPGWDTMLHTLNGFLCAAIGLALINILNNSRRFAFNLSPLFASLVAFCFSMTVGVVWEFFEFGMDIFFRTDMQKDSLVQLISSVTLHPDGRNIPVTVTDIISTIITGTVNGETQTITMNGYLDIGIIDTMRDLFVNFVGAVVFSVAGYFYVKHQKEHSFVEKLMPSRIETVFAENDDTAVENEKKNNCSSDQ